MNHAVTTAVILLCVLAYLSRCFSGDGVTLFEMHRHTEVETMVRPRAPVPPRAASELPQRQRGLQTPAFGPSLPQPGYQRPRRPVEMEGGNEEVTDIRTDSAGEHYPQGTKYDSGSSLGANGRHGYHVYKSSTTTITIPLSVCVIIFSLAALVFRALIICVRSVYARLTYRPIKSCYGCQQRSSFSPCCKPAEDQSAAEPQKPPPAYSPNYALPLCNPQGGSASENPTTNYEGAQGIRPETSSRVPGVHTGAASSLLGYLYGSRNTDAGKKRARVAPTEAIFKLQSIFADNSSRDELSYSDVDGELREVTTSTGFGRTDRR